VTVYSDEGSATTVLPAARRAHAHAALPAFAPARKGRRLGIPAGVLVAGAILAVIAGALYTISPLSPIRSHSSDFTPQAALMALNSNDAQSGGPWDTSAGAAQALGLGGGAGPGVTAPGSAGLPVATGGDGGNFTASPGAVFISAAPVSPWPPDDPFMEVPNHPAYRVGTSSGYYSGAFGQCTWWAAYSRHDENLTYLGDAHSWAVDAQARGYRVGRVAAPNATVVFYPGAQGAGGAGHVAHVEAVYPGGWFLVSEMNFYWNGGGWGRVDYRFAHEGAGVAFIY
jgi:surface antigen